MPLVAINISWQIGQDERKESQGAERSSEGARAEHSHGQSSGCAQQRAISYTANQGFAKAVRGNSHGGMNNSLPIFYILKLKHIMHSHFSMFNFFITYNCLNLVSIKKKKTAIILYCLEVLENFSD